MEFKVNNKEFNELIQKFLEGGEIAPETQSTETAPAPEQGGDPLMQLAAAFLEGLNNQDCQLLAQAAQAFLEMVGGGAPTGPTAPEGELPVFKKGGKLSKWISK